MIQCETRIPFFFLVVRQVHDYLLYKGVKLGQMQQAYHNMEFYTLYLGYTLSLLNLCTVQQCYPVLVYMYMYITSTTPNQIRPDQVSTCDMLITATQTLHAAHVYVTCPQYTPLRGPSYLISSADLTTPPPTQHSQTHKHTPMTASVAYKQAIL